MQNEKHILVTGGTGFLGSYLLRMLIQQGHTVRATKRPRSSMDLLGDAAAKVEWVDADVTDLGAMEEAFEGIQQVYHCAAMVSFHPRDYRQMNQINVEGTANIVNLCLEFGVEKLVHVSSIAALGRSPEHLHITEDTKWSQSKNTTRYSISKYQSEQEVWRGHAEGLPVAIVNPSIVLGSGFWNLGSARFFKQVYEGLKFWPDGRSGFVDVRDVAHTMILLMNSHISGERYVLNAENVEFYQFFQQIALNLGKKPPFIKVTPLLAEVAWRVEWLKEKLLGAEPIVTKESARSSQNPYTYGNEKSLTIPGIHYRPVAETLRETAAQCLDASKDGFSARVLDI